MAKVSGHFHFNKHDTLGAAAAEEDKAYLADCYIDTGDLKELENPNSHRRIVIGRTGSGKTALLLKLAEQPDTFMIDPESLSLNYITNSTIIQYLDSQDINLEPFYKLLWRHLFVVEVLRHIGDITSSSRKSRFIDWILQTSSTRQQYAEERKRRQRAVEYLDRYGANFWQDTSSRAKEITDRFERSVSSELAGQAKGGTALKFPLASADASGSSVASREWASNLSIEQRRLVENHGQEIINRIQVAELSEILNLLSELMAENGRHFTFVIDRLDEGWVENRVRFKLIRSLIDTCREFTRVPGVRLVLGMRVDLIESVFRETRGAGFQEEKYRSLFLPIEWNRQQLITLLDNRVRKLVKDRHCLNKVGIDDILPKSMAKKDIAVPAKIKSQHRRGIDYLLARTWNRPRDLIEFINLCIEQAGTKSQISVNMIHTAEGHYSRSRIRALGDEWNEVYPTLINTIKVLFRNRPRVFPLSELSEDGILELLVDLQTSAEQQNRDCPLATSANRAYNGDIAPTVFLREAIWIMYRVGACGLKLSGPSTVEWIGAHSPELSLPSINEDCRVSIHPALWHVLGVVP